MMKAEIRRLYLGLLLFSVTIPGCGGCQQKSAAPQSDSTEESDSIVIISDPQPLPYGNEINRMLVKPGHVAEMQQEFKIGQRDINGRIEGQSVSSTGDLLPVPGSRWNINFTRDAALPNRQTKRFDLRFFISPTLDEDDEDLANTSKTPRLLTTLLDRETGTPVVSPKPSPTTPLLAHQYFLVVLADKKEDYQYLSKSDIVAWQSLEIEGEQQAAYQLVLCDKQGDRWMLPSTFFGWTSTAYLIWDDVDPDSLSSSQKQALIDWLHWGGQLIVSGPNSWTRLQGSFLAPYLPFTNASNVALSQSLVDELNRDWALPEPSESSLHEKGKPLDESQPEAQNDKLSEDDNTPIPNVPAIIDTAEEQFIPVIIKSSDPVDKLPPLPERTLTSLQGDLAADASWILNSKQIACERKIGRGRVVVATIPLSEPYFSRWRSFSGLVNSVFLGRPPRRWEETSFNARQTWKYNPGQEYDSRIATQFRIATRDAAENNSGQEDLFTASHKTRTLLGEPATFSRPTSYVAAWEGDPINGVAAWNSGSAVSKFAKDILGEAAGVNVPKLSTILTLLLTYLVCLVPLNWLIFYLFGKLEWAWATVPVISLVGVVAVATIAQLDIGFARSYTEVAVVEAFANHPRAHVTRYSAIYSSLSTPYRLSLESDNGMTVPMISREITVSNDLVESVRFQYGSSEGNTLYPLYVLSNSTTLLHTEQILDLGGAFEFKQQAEAPQRFAIANNSKYSWQAVSLIRRNEEGLLEGCFIDRLESGVSLEGSFSTSGFTSLVDYWGWRARNRQGSPSVATAEEASYAKLLYTLSAPHYLKRGEVRLVAFAPRSLDGLSVEPLSNSILQHSVLLLNLRAASGPVPERDISLPSRKMVIEQEKRETESEEDETTAGSNSLDSGQNSQDTNQVQQQEP